MAGFQSKIAEKFEKSVKHGKQAAKSKGQLRLLYIFKVRSQRSKRRPFGTEIIRHRYPALEALG